MKSTIYGTIEVGKYRNAPAVLETPRGATPQIGAVMRKHSIPPTTEDTSEEVPYGYCQCGCGRKTNIAPKSNTKRGYVKGVPYKYISQHAQTPARPVPEWSSADQCYRVPLNSTSLPGCFALVDECDIEWITKHSWHPIGSRDTGVYAERNAPENGRGAKLLMHREILNAPPEYQVDHINGNCLDNRRQNLRLAEHHQNQANMRVPISNSHGFKGISFHRKSGLWQARVKYKQRNYSAGYFHTKEDAARAYDKKAIELFGEFARTNAMLGLLGEDKS